MLEIKNLTVKVKNNTPILTDVSLSIDEGTCIGLTGASGSGKTTLIKSIMGMNSGDLEITQGQILLDGDNLLIHGAKERRARQRHLFPSVSNVPEYAGAVRRSLWNRCI